MADWMENEACNTHWCRRCTYCRAGGGAGPDACHLARRARGKRRFFYLFRGNDLPLSRAYGMPKDTEEQKAERERVLEAALDLACGVPLKIMEKCCEAIALMEEFAQKGSRLALSDAGVGSAFCRAALEGAALNVFINTKLMKDRSRAQELNEKAETMLRQYSLFAAQTYDMVRASLR